MTETTLAETGHNLPPSDADPLRERLSDDHAELVKRRDELLAAAERAPETVDEGNAGKIGDFIKQLAAHMKTLDATRVAEKEPYLAGGRNVDGFFKPLTESLNKANRTIESRLNVFLRAKAEEERRQREAEAKRRAEEEARLRAEAEAAEKAARDAQSLEDAIAAENRAKQAEADRLKAQREAEAKAADMSRTRGDYGSVASLRTFWDYEVQDIHVIPLDVLRPHLPIAAVEQAIRSFVKAGGRDLAGVRIFENTSTQVR